MKRDKLIALVESGELLFGAYWDTATRTYVNLAYAGETRRPVTPAAAANTSRDRLVMAGETIEDLQTATLAAIHEGYVDSAAMMARRLFRATLALDGRQVEGRIPAVRWRLVQGRKSVVPAVRYRIAGTSRWDEV